MKNPILKIFVLAAALAVVSSCGLFRKYKNNQEAPDALFIPELAEIADEGLSAPAIPWREYFTDTLLQRLIDTALVRNADLNCARKSVEQAQAVLESAKLGYIPSFSVSPSFNLAPGQSYSAPLNLSWGVQGFGSITNRLRESKVLALQASDNEETVRSKLIASVARYYYELQMLHRQYDIVSQTERVWEELLVTQRALMENGKCYSTAVNQMEASLYESRIRQIDLNQSIIVAESTLCSILGYPPMAIECLPWYEFRMPERLSVGIPADLLRNRPDVRAAEREVEAAYYVNRQAVAAMFPSLSLDGIIGWTSGNGPVVSPGQLLYSAVASLAQPVFAQGKLRANLKVTRLRQEQAAANYAQKIVDAGNDVNTALLKLTGSDRKGELYKSELLSLEDAFEATRELMYSGKAMYIEVLVAQNSLLTAQLAEVNNVYEGACAMVDLYIALGGGTK